MSSSEFIDMKNMVIKTEPPDSFEQEDRVLSRTNGKSEAPIDGSKNNCKNIKEFAEKVRKIKRSNSSSDESSASLDSSLKQFPAAKGIKRSDSYEETVSSLFTSEFPCSAENSDLKEFKDQKPSREELEICSRGLSELNSAHSLHGSEAALPLTHGFAQSDGDRKVRTGGCTPDLNDLNLLSPVVMLSPIKPSQLPSTSRRKYTASLPSKKRGYSKKKFEDCEILIPIMDEDGVITSYQCQRCSKLFNKRQTLRQHFITHTDRFACRFCGARCKSNGDLTRHIQTHTKEKPYHCDVCNTDYTRESILKKHMKTQRHQRASFDHENLTHLREVIHKKERNVKTRVKTRKQVKLVSFSCSLCQKVTYSNAEYRKHTRSHAFKFICSVCQKGCKSSLLLKIHKRSHSKSTRLSCKVCSRSFASLYSLKEHIKLHRSGSCSKLTKKAIITAAVSKHNKDTGKIKLNSLPVSNPKPCTSIKNILASAREYKCFECHKTFFSKRYLINHRRNHEETYVCGLCNNVYSNISKLKIHLKFHERIVKCDICGITFYERKELLNHINKLHAQKLNDSEFTCRLCYDQFDNASALENHMTDHAPTMLFSGKSFDESTMPVVNRSKRKQSPGSLADTTKVVKMEAVSDGEEVKVTKRSDKQEASKSDDSGDESILESQEFYEMLNSALDGSDDNLNYTEVSDSDDELTTGIKNVLENEVLSSDETDDSESKKPFVFRKPLFYEHEEITKKHCTEFEIYSEKDVDRHVFKCKPCDLIFCEDKYLNNHLKQHVCAYCNTFFGDREEWAAHKSYHVRKLLKEIKTEADRLHIPKQKWKGYLMASSNSESEVEDQILSEVEDVFEDESLLGVNAVNFLRTLSHDEIVQANRSTFEKYSCLDLSKNIFACIICKRKYARPTTLTRHLKTHVCQFCNKFFEDKSDLLEHKYSHRKKAALIKAEITGEGSEIPSSSLASKPNRDMFKKHSFIDSDRSVFRCTLCQKDFVRRTVLTRHLKTHVCGHCDKFFENKCELNHHLLFLQAKNLSMKGSGAEDELLGNDDDEKQFSASISIVENVDDVLKNVTLLPSSTVSLPHIRTSLQSQSSSSSRSETVALIQIPSAENGETVDTKMFSVAGINTSSFPIISEPVAVYKNTAQEPLLVVSASCQDNKCKKIATVSQSQILSTVADERERPFQCGECGKKFLKSDHLLSHMTIHTGERPFTCRLCGKAFGRCTILQKHMKTHLKQCKICEATFTYKFELDIHMEVHKT